jgi:drug/metabolite transporter (DMT)-like permease
VSAARATTTADLVRLGTLAALWGASFIFFRVLAPVFGPALTALLRVSIAGLALVAFFRLTGVDLRWRDNALRYIGIGAVNSAIPFTLFGYAALHLPAGYSAILNAATPLFAVLLSALFADERLTWARAGGLSLGIAGVALVTRAGPVAPDGDFVLAVLACLGATFCYAAVGLYVAHRGRDLAPRAIAACSQIGAAIVLLPVALAQPAPAPAAITPLVVANVLALALLCSAAAYLLYYRLIADIGPSRAMSVTFLIPLFGMLWGNLFLDEAVTAVMVTGCALVIAGTLLVLRRVGDR